jgi:hypothetical protein
MPKSRGRRKTNELPTTAPLRDTPFDPGPTLPTDPPRDTSPDPVLTYFLDSGGALYRRSHHLEALIPVELAHYP